MRLLHLYRPHLPLELARARASEPFPPGPLVLGGRPWDPGPVIDANPEARALGVRRGMPLGSAHRLVPEATFVDPDPDADRATVEAAFEALAAFSPGIAGSTDPLDAAFGLFEVQVDGLEPLWGPEPVLVERLVAALGRALGERDRSGERQRHPGRDRRDPLRATVAAVLARPGAPDPRPARWRGRLPRPASVRPPHPGPGRPGPAHPLRPAPDRGGRRAGPDPRSSPGSARRGRGSTPGRAARSSSRSGRAGPRSAFGSALPIEPPVEDLEPLRFVLHRLAAALTGQLVARGLAASRARLHLDLDLAFARAGTSPIVDVEQRFPEPTADAEAIERLLFARLERTPPPAAVARLALELDGTAPAAGQQLPLFTPQAARGARLDWQLARLALTFGEDRVRRVDVTDPEAPLPETRWAWRPVVSGERGVAS